MSSLVLTGCGGGGSAKPDPTKIDTDGDGVVDAQDAFPNDPNETEDTDNDGVGNNADTDDDNDGVPDTDDAFPLDDSESVDTDNDGVGNNSDSDDDNDGVIDSDDAFPLDDSETTDTDGDGIGNNADLDDDNDGVVDEEDDAPLDDSVYDLTNPTVTTKSPEEGSSEVSTDATISATFSETLAAESVTNGNFVLKIDNEIVESQVNYNSDSQSIHLTPSSPLGFFKNYTAQITTAITDAAGNPLSELIEWSFTTGDGSWKTETLIEDIDTGAGRAPEIAVDDNGNAIAVWYQYDGEMNSIYANHYSPTTGWGEAILLENNQTGSAYYPKVVMDNEGNAIAVWYLDDGEKHDAWSSIYQPQIGWSEPELIENIESGAAVDVELAMDSSGNALAVWRQHIDTNKFIYVNKYTKNEGWGSAEAISALTDQSYGAKVAVNASGEAIVAWYGNDGSAYSIYARNYSPEFGWGTETLLESNTYRANLPQVAINNSGNALVVWNQIREDNRGSQLWANSFTPESGWQGAVGVDTTADWVYYDSAVALSENNTAIAVWTHVEGDVESVWSSQFTFDNGWQSPAELASSNGPPTQYNLVIDSNDNAMVSWTSYDSESRAYGISTKRYTPTTGWQERIEIDSNPDNANTSSLAINSLGHVFAVWSGINPNRSGFSIYFNEFN